MVRTGLAVGGAVLVLMGGAALTWGAPSETRTTALPGVSTVELGRGAARVEIEREPGGEARIHTERTGWGGSGAGGGASYRLDEDRLVLEPRCGWGCRVNYRVSLPERARVTGELGSGSLRVTGMSATDVRVGSGGLRLRDVSGGVTASTGSGGVELAEVAGPVDVDTGSGAVEGTNIHSEEVTAHTSSGEISLELSAPRAVRADTGSGGIELEVADKPYRVATDTGSGRTDVEVERDRNARSSLRLSTGSGSIEIDPR
ncbi:DUF4097 family beta strand repeat-containing protein [Actinopolyspora halophila]|uniref:DUF4097 family beta strand repeat-containing protein n=1 Tax=Actinopolyspora halophila TaxID=1850 RepID=UPI0003A7D2E6|nr:DUF4097 family beta strand repeat-containing protein [Actinopolyspora halophila]